MPKCLHRNIESSFTQLYSGFVFPYQISGSPIGRQFSFRWGVYMSSDSKIMYWVKTVVHFGVFYFFGFRLSLREIHNVDLKVLCPQRPYNRIALIENKTSYYSGAYFGFNETVKANNPNSFVFFVHQ